MKIDTNMILILGLGGLALYLFMKGGGFGNLNDNDMAVAQQYAQQQQMNAMQTQALLKMMNDLKADIGAGKDDNPWDDPTTWNMFAQTAGQIVGAVGSFF